MSSNRDKTLTRAELVEYIKRQLGYPTRNAIKYYESLLAIKVEFISDDASEPSETPASEGTPDTVDIVHKVVLDVKIRAKSGEEVPFYKIRRFIYYLRDKLGYNIQSVSQDSWQSVDSLQNLQLGGFNTSTLSVDRSRAPYDTLRNAINEERIIAYRNSDREAELLDLVDDKKYNKIDHTSTGSKDVADCIAACVFKASEFYDPSMHKEESSAVMLNQILDMTEKESDLDRNDVRNWI